MAPLRVWIATLGVLLALLPTAAMALRSGRWPASQVEAMRKSERIMREANTHRGLLAQYKVMHGAYVDDDDPAFRVIFGQYLSWYQSYIGDYPAAAATFAIKQVALPDDRPSPLTDEHYTAQPALQAIAELARPYRAVFFNEAHNVAQTRTLTVQLLAKLHAEGFDYFAAETLYQSDTKLSLRGYPTRDSGFYTEEPIYAEMVRTALKLGYKVIAYEDESAGSPDQREAAQARNIYRQVFKRDPQARLVVNAGYGHILEQGRFLGGSSMAEHLRRIAGIDPLTVEQTMLFGHAARSDDHPVYTAVMQQLHPKVPIVFVDKAGKPWSLRAGYDVSVFFPRTRLQRGRPTWLDLGGLRRPYFVSGERCRRSYPCLVEARYADEGADAIPADRLLLNTLPPNPVASDRLSNGLVAPGSDLYLRPGKYRLRCIGEDDRTLFHRNITVRPEPPPRATSTTVPAAAPCALAKTASPDAVTTACGKR